MHAFVFFDAVQPVIHDLGEAAAHRLPKRPFCGEVGLLLVHVPLHRVPDTLPNLRRLAAN